MVDIPAHIPMNIEFDGSTTMQIQFITWFIFDPCEAPWMLYLELAAKPGGQLALAMTTPIPSEVVEQWVDPTRSRRCNARRRRPTKRAGRTATSAAFKARAARSAAAIARGLLKSPGAILRAPMAFPDTNTIIANRLPQRADIFGPGMVSGERFFWPLFNQVERVLLTLFVWDQIFTFLYEWMSALMRTEQCQASALARCRMLGGSGNMPPTSDFSTLPLTGSTLTFGNCIINIGAVSFPGAPFSIATGLTLRGQFGSFGPVELQLQISDTQGTRVTDLQQVVVPQNDAVSVVLRASTRGPGQVSVKINTFGGFYIWQNHWINAVAAEKG